MTRAAVITVSDRSAAGDREDASGPVAVAALREAGFDCAEAVVVPGRILTSVPSCVPITATDERSGIPEIGIRSIGLAVG